eukprot:15172-Heterococcus_DN1.PRE.1
MSNRRSHYTSTNEDETLLEGTAESAQGFALFVMVCMLIFAVTSYRNNRRVRATTASSATVRNVGTGREPRTNEDCPVCLGDLQLPIETNCGHLFCGSCIHNYWEQ